MTLDLYALLRIRRDAPKETIIAAYRALAKDAHPDTGGNREEFDRLTLARDVLCDEAARAHYDKTGEAKRPEPDTSHAPMMGMLANIFDAMMNECAKAKVEPHRVNFHNLMISALKNRREASMKNREAATAGIAKLEKMQTRFRRLDGGANFMDEIISGRIALGRNYIASSEIEVRRIDAALAYLDGVTFDLEMDFSPNGPTTTTM